MSSIRILGVGDERQLSAFFEHAPDRSLMQRSNLARAGAGWSGQRYGGMFAGAFDGARLSGVIAHYWNGFLLPLVGDIARDFRPLLDALLDASPLPVNGAVGDWDQVTATLMHPRINGRAVRRCAREILYGLPLEALRVPEPLRLGEIGVRAIAADDVPMLTAWRMEFLVDTFKLSRGPATFEEAAGDLDAALREKRGFVVEADGRMLAYSGFNAALPDVVQVGGVYTPPFARARGLARAAVAGSLLKARESGARRAVLFTDVANVAAQRAYGALGFSAVGDWGIARF
ncbi:MAG: GNAT family N-acetyltransferase [Alphaproteobacteria bacterium]|nr:GNAT family N-acetyltransferase [Alphaproteobacteria bacterium]